MMTMPTCDVSGNILCVWNWYAHMACAYFGSEGVRKAWTLSVSLTQTHTDMHTLIAHLTLPRSLWFSASHLSNITCSSSLADAPSSRPQDKKRKN